MVRREARLKRLIERTDELNDSHQVIQLDAQIELPEQKLKQIDVGDVLDIGLEAHVEREDGLDVLHVNAKVGVPRLENDWEERHHLPLVVDLQPV